VEEACAVILFIKLRGQPLELPVIAIHLISHLGHLQCGET